MKARKKIDLPRRKILDVLDADGETIHTVLADTVKNAQVIRRALYRVLNQKLRRKVKFKTRAA